MSDKQENKVSGKVYDVKLFGRLMQYARAYRLQFTVSAIAVISVALFAAVRPTLLKQVIDQYISNKDAEQLLFYVLLMLGALIFEVLSQFLFIYFANWLGQNIIKDMRKQLFSHLLNFKMNYFNRSSVGR